VCICVHVRFLFKQALKRLKDARMNVPAIARYAETLRYDRNHGTVRALDWRAYPNETLTIEFDSAEAIAAAIEVGIVGPWTGPYLAGYGLALAARAWADRPSEARRGALIQAGERLRTAASDRRLDRLVLAMLDRGDAAILGGGDAEDVVLGSVEAEIARADRVAERSGRLAAGLLDEADAVLVPGFAGAALAWMLAFAREEGKQPRLAIPAGPEGGDDVRITEGLAAELGVPTTTLDGAGLEAGLAEGAFGIMFAGAAALALDGAVLVRRGAAQLALQARDAGVPRYVLGYDGPDPAAATALDLAAPGDDGNEILAASLISAIITTRGIYRPEMIARYLGDGDAPLDVIPLSLT
jgi:methylthioribose-1-phosphate isomerase